MVIHGHSGSSLGDVLSDAKETRHRDSLSARERNGDERVIRMMLAYLPLFLALIGLVMYFICVRAEAKEVGRIMFAFGLLAFLLRDLAVLLKG